MEEIIQVVKVSWWMEFKKDDFDSMWYFRDGNGYDPCSAWILSNDHIVDATILMWEKTRQGYTVEIQPSIWEQNVCLMFDKGRFS